MTIVFMFCFVFHANLKKSILDTFIVMIVLDIFGNPYQKLAHVMSDFGSVVCVLLAIGNR